MNRAFEHWLGQHKEPLLHRWIQRIAEQALPHYRGLSPAELQRALSPFYDCLAKAIQEDASPVQADLEDWLLSQRLDYQCTLGELLQIVTALKALIWQDLAVVSDRQGVLQFGERVEQRFDQAIIALASLFTQAIEQTLMERLQEAEFITHSLSTVTEEMDQTLQRMRTLYEASQALAATLDLGEVLQVAASEMRRASRVEEVGIILFNPEEGVGELVAEEPPRPDPQPPPLYFTLDSIPSLGEFLTASQSLSLEEAQHTPLLRSLRTMIEARGTHAPLLIPLLLRGQITGMFYLGFRTEARPLQRDEVQLAHTLANQIATTIENARLYEEIKNFNAILGRRVRERTQELAAEKERVEYLYAIASETNASLDLNLTLERTLQLVTQAAKVERGAILLRERETDHLVCRAAIGAGGLLDVGESIPFRMGEGLAGWVALHREPAVVADVEEDPRWLIIPGHEVPYRSYIAVPIITGGEIEGVLTLAHPDRAYFTDEHLRLLNAVAQELGEAIHNAELYRYVQAQTERLGQLLAVQEAEASKSRAILESIADGVVFSDAEGRIVLANAAAEQILGTTVERIRGRDIRDLVQLAAVEDRPAWQSAINNLMTGRNLSLGTAASARLTVDIGERIANVHLSPVIITKEEFLGEDRGAFLGLVMVFRDVTREVEADRLKTDFVATVSHELRTPLTSIRGYVDLLLDGDVGEVSSEMREYLEIVRNNSDRLTTLINDLLDISRIETGRARFDLAPLAPATVVEEALALVRQAAAEKNLTLQTDLPAVLPPILADREGLTQALHNLLDNAIKYTPTGGVTVQLTVREDNKVQFDVIDTGIGIAPADRDKLFTRFFRADDPLVRFAGGTGLGLSIAKAIVEAHHGEIWATSPGPAGRGSVFSFTIPLAAETPAWTPVSLAEAPRLAAPVTTPRRLLVVDDDRDVIRLLYHRLRRDGYLVDTATSGSDALIRAAETQPDLILLDILMPEMDGYQVLERLKADPTTSDIPVVILSIVGEREQGLALGAAEYLTKPFDEQQLEAIIGEILGRVGRVLIADDDPDIAALLQRVLQRRGFEAVVAGDGEATLARARAEPAPDLILLDLQMPKVHGYQILEELRGSPTTRSIPVVIITGATPDLEAKRQQSFALGATRFIPKPIDMESLVREIERLIGS